jgi:hypothetical protein
MFAAILQFLKDLTDWPELDPGHIAAEFGATGYVEVFEQRTTVNQIA